MADRVLIVWDIHPAEPQGPAGCEAMGIFAESDTQSRNWGSSHVGFGMESAAKTTRLNPVALGWIILASFARRNGDQAPIFSWSRAGVADMSIIT